MSIVNILSILPLARVNYMITYEPFYQTLFKKGLTEYSLIFKQGFSAATLHRMKKGQGITLKTLDTLCFILDCDITDIIKYKKE